MKEQPTLTRLRDLNQNPIQIQHTLQDQRLLPEQAISTLTTSTNQQSPHNCSDHAHGHGHGESHAGHNHGSHAGHNHGQPKNPRKPGEKNFLVIFYTIFTCLSCLYLETQHLNPLISDTKAKYMSYFAYFDVIMCLWSYIQTIRNSSSIKKLKGIYQIQHIQSVIHDPLFDLKKKKCEICDYSKFPRVSHCSTCGTCIYKLDHHCVWTQTCIGYRNQKSFYLFCFYMSVGVFQFWYSTIRAFSHLFSSCQFFSFFEPLVYVLWLITSASAFVVGVMIVMLAIAHTIMIKTNHTSLDSIKQKKACPIPYCEFRNNYLTDKSINPYDRGQIQNIKSIIGDNIFTFWMPFAREINNQFIIQKVNPYPSRLQLMRFTELYTEELYYQKEVQKHTANVKGLYKGRKMKVQGNVIEV